MSPKRIASGLVPASGPALAKGRTVALPVLDPGPYAFRASMAYVGLTPRKDINRSVIRLLGGVV